MEEIYGIGWRLFEKGFLEEEGSSEDLSSEWRGKGCNRRSVKVWIFLVVSLNMGSEIRILIKGYRGCILWVCFGEDRKRLG